MPQAPHPGELCQPGFRTPGVGGRCQEIGRSLAEKCARVRPHVLDAILVEPVLHFADGVPMLFRMLILIPQPGLAARRLGVPLAQHRIEWHPRSESTRLNSSHTVISY